jgi:predicted HTH domain antitoxin
MWELKQLEKLREIEPETVDGAIKTLLDQETGLKEKLIIGAYIDGDINFGKAAELLNLHPIQLRELFLSRGIPIKIGVSSEEEVRAESFAAKTIRADAE